MHRRHTPRYTPQVTLNGICMSERQNYGNRLPVPPSVCAPHFCYKTRAPVLDPTDTQVVIDAIRSCRKRPPDGYATAFGKSDPVFQRHPPRREALARLTQRMQDFTGLLLKVEVVACRMSSGSAPSR